MSKIEVVKEKLPSRCEICHKEDMFDPLTNSCLRCKEISYINKVQNSASTDSKKNNSTIGLLAGSLSGIFISIMGVITLFIVYKWFVMTEVIVLLILGLIMGLIIGGYCTFIFNFVKHKFFRYLLCLLGGSSIGFAIFSFSIIPWVGLIVGFLITLFSVLSIYYRQIRYASFN